MEQDPAWLRRIAMEKYPVGLKVYLPPVDGIEIPNTGIGLRQPKPGAVGKRGTITAYVEVSVGGRSINVPIITLEDGTTLSGMECWWEPAKEGS